MIGVLSGGVGAARFLRGLVEVVDPDEVTAIVNTADDFTLHGLYICPDLDTVRSTLADDVGPNGWGRANESWVAMNELRTLCTSAPANSRATDWFSLGDRDLAVHLYRSQRLAEGAGLTGVTTELCNATDVQTRLLPVTDDPVATELTLASGEQTDFQEYFVARRHAEPVGSIHYAGAEGAVPASGVLETIATAQRLVVAPSNPLLSIAPILAVPGVAEALRSRREDTVAISPIVGGDAVKGPARHLMEELGHEPSVTGIARMWTQYASTLFVDEVDTHLCDAVKAEGMDCVPLPTLMVDLETSVQLARAVLI